MPNRLNVRLSEDQRASLVTARDYDRRPYVREKAAAILKVGDGMSAQQVAMHGLLKKRHPETVRRWVAQYLDEGLAALKVKAGRGRKPAFSPSARDGRAGQGGPVGRGPARSTIAGL